MREIVNGSDVLTGEGAVWEGFKHEGIVCAFRPEMKYVGTDTTKWGDRVYVVTECDVLSAILDDEVIIGNCVNEPDLEPTGRVAFVGYGKFNNGEFAVIDSEDIVAPVDTDEAEVTPVVEETPVQPWDVVAKTE